MGTVRNWPLVLVAAITFLSMNSGASAQESAADLAKKLSNPIASLISVPFQFNYDGGYGPNDGEKYYVNVQPVIPFRTGTSSRAPSCRSPGRTI